LLTLSFFCSNGKQSSPLRASSSKPSFRADRDQRGFGDPTNTPAVQSDHRRLGEATALFFLQTPVKLADDGSVISSNRRNPLLTRLVRRDRDRHDKVELTIQPRGMEHASCMRMHLCQSQTTKHLAPDEGFLGLLARVERDFSLGHADLGFSGERLGDFWKRCEDQRDALLRMVQHKRLEPGSQAMLLDCDNFISVLRSTRSPKPAWNMPKGSQD